VIRKKNEIQENLPPHISMEKLMDRLNLDFTQIKKLYDLRSTSIATEEKYLLFANKIIANEIMGFSEELRAILVKMWLTNYHFRARDSVSSTKKSAKFVGALSAPIWLDNLACSSVATLSTSHVSMRRIALSTAPSASRRT